MTFLCALVLADRGELEFHAPVARYWPEFAAGGKERVEVRHVMGHTAGLSGWTEPLEPEDLADWEKVTSLLAAQEPWWEPGSASGYHAVTQGFLIGEIVRRITGSSIGSFFADEIAGPLGADFHIGLPAEDDRRVSFVIPPPPIDTSGIDPDSLVFRTLANPARRRHGCRATRGGAAPRSRPRTATAMPDRWQRSSRSSPGAAKREASGCSRPKGCDPIFEEQANGTDLVLGVPLRFGMGYGLSNDLLPIGPRACYWGGYGGSVVVMDQETRLTVCYVMNRMESGLVGDPRGVNIVMAAVMGLLGVG